MCRKKYLRGCCISTFGLGLLVGHCLESWLMSCIGGLILLVLGFCMMRKN